MFKDWDKGEEFRKYSYEKLRAAVQMVKGTAHQPPKALLQEARTWAEDVGGRSSKYRAYCEWLNAQEPVEKTKPTAPTWLEKIEQEDFDPKDLAIEDWADIWDCKYKEQMRGL